ncbi:LamG domain-containing protein [Leptospira neocaledonica]|uniref:Concanavalin n=1 Tax=Leptospira neocaledonica TaxID=2023192 RepID=A0A2N0A011_9LEPT|nr:LamG domain-containing protein [Leptospira neocaledonica]PJZ77591.1 concanavalin [Leptospira neocaledonica]
MRILIFVLLLLLSLTNCGTYLLLASQENEHDHSFSDFIRLTLIDSSIGLVHYWPLDGNTRDVIGGLDLTDVSGTPTLTFDRFGFPEKAYYYDGSGPYHESIAQGPLFLDGTVSSFTVSAWVNGKWPPGANGGQSIFLSQDGGLGLQFYALSSISCTGRLRAFTNNSGGQGDADVSSQCGAFSENTWYHMVFVWDIQNLTASLYVNNVLVSSGKFGSNRPWNVYSTFALGFSPLGTFLYQGSIDEVRVYNRAIFPVSSL